ncbi:EamA-like transporter family protein [Loktanella sp. DSM 29012]|uniref:DMT family transporter n=1 Tax=Loktanella sp. DSM 29012 TaxID=1881056 RepID=UPI0008C6592B|nr:DMT family transporter [Loktanella sp. DSM 29012]SEP98968.1 EamA-like transporter family protein [Loktanella sp. DSM 29012]
MPNDRPFTGILLMLGFCVLAPLGDGMAKLLGGAVVLGTLVLARFAIQAAVLVPLVLARGQDLRAPHGTRRLVWLRSALHIAGMTMMFASLRYLPLADALAIAFVMPFILLLLGRIFMDEQVGPQRMIACAVGFAGTLLVIQPNFVDVGLPALLPLGVAVTFALFMLVTRSLSGRIDPIRLQAIGGLQATLLVSIGLLVLPGPQAGFALPGTGALWLVVLMGLVGTAAHLLMTWSLRCAPASTLAPMQYLEIPFGTVIGWAMFGDLPNGLAACGIVVTVAAGLYVIVRERNLARRAIPTAPA